jgi:hypothetical protein
LLPAQARQVFGFSPRSLLALRMMRGFSVFCFIFFVDMTHQSFG